MIVAHPPPPGLYWESFSFHPHPVAGEEIATLAAMTTAGGPAILLGDFNTTDQGDHYALVTDAGLVDAFRAAGWGFGVTWPLRPLAGVLSLPPLLRLDYIFHTPHFYPLRAWVGPAIGSDHLPVLAELAWIDDGPVEVEP